MERALKCIQTMLAVNQARRVDLVTSLYTILGHGASTTGRASTF
jgi:hypothetical protein